MRRRRSAPKGAAAGRRVLALLAEVAVPNPIVRDPVSACGTKARLSPRTAELAAAAARRRSGHQNIVAYACRYCPAWHIGHLGGPPGESAAA